MLAEDDPSTRLTTRRHLRSWGYEALVAGDGEVAWELLESVFDPSVVLLDWEMPSVDGLQICQRIRAQPKDSPLRYVIMLTSRQDRDDIVSGLEAGADDYITKPFHPAELRARIRNGVRLLSLQQSLSLRVQELEAAHRQVNELQGLLPICSYCKRVRDDRNYWTQVEAYLGEHLDLQFSHGICPSCYEKVVEPEIDRLPQRLEASKPHHRTCTHQKPNTKR